jgi:LPS sulfotransferase NodH
MRDELLNNIDFNADALFTRVKSIYNEEKGWFNYLDSKAISYMKLFYEDNIKDIDQTVKSILTYVGLDTNDLTKKTLAESRFKKTSTRVNDEQYERYISDEELINRTRALGIEEERWL